MKKTTKILLLSILFFIILILQKNNKVEAYEYIWPIAGDNANETYKDYDFYGQQGVAPYKDGKSGREYIVDNSKWPDEQYYYSACESHFGMDITGLNGHTYNVISVVNGTVIATSGTSIYSPSVNYPDRNQRRTVLGLHDGGGYGNYVIIQESTTGRCFLYAHLRGGTITVNKGDNVQIGQQIGTMGSSGDAGHMHLHFEIRKSIDYTLYENRYGYHFLRYTNSYSNLDPEDFIGSEPHVHVPFVDLKNIQLNEEDAKYYIGYLYETILKRSAKYDEKDFWFNKYIESGSIAYITQGIILSEEATLKNGELSNLDFAKKLYEILLYRGDNYTEAEMAEDISKVDTGIWTREDYITSICNCDEFSQTKIYQIIKNEKKKIPSLASKENLKTTGDLNGDGYIDALDACVCLSLYDYYMETPESENIYLYALEYADMDNNGVITLNDASRILEIYADNSVIY